MRYGPGVVHPGGLAAVPVGQDAAAEQVGFGVGLGGVGRRPPGSRASTRWSSSTKATMSPVIRGSALLSAFDLPGTGSANQVRGKRPQARSRARSPSSRACVPSLHVLAATRIDTPHPCGRSAEFSESSARVSNPTRLCVQMRMISWCMLAARV